MKTNKPLITVYMPVFNAAEFLDQSIQSILTQTFSDFEFIIVDDASTDDSWKIIKSYAKKDSRIIAFKNHINLGVSLTSNIAISKARGKFLARMDADDISLPQRFEKQVNYLKKHSQTVAVGTQCFMIDRNNQIIGNKNFPTQFKKLAKMIFWAIPIQQPSMMVNLSKLPHNFVWYSPTKNSAEEVDLMFRFMLYGQINNLPNSLLFYRHLDTSLSHKNPKNTFNLTIKSRLAAIKLGFRPTFSAIILNLCQIIIISLLPNSLINQIWSSLRGINRSSSSKLQYNLVNEVSSQA
jgi:glycosyltransferase involved in cell wall biosynthesis